MILNKTFPNVHVFWVTAADVGKEKPDDVYGLYSKMKNDPACGRKKMLENKQSPNHDFINLNLCLSICSCYIFYAFDVIWFGFDQIVGFFFFCILKKAANFCEEKPHVPKNDSPAVHRAIATPSTQFCMREWEPCKSQARLMSSAGKEATQ